MFGNTQDALFALLIDSGHVGQGILYSVRKRIHIPLVMVDDWSMLCDGLALAE